MTMHSSKPLPDTTDPDYAPFWDACRRHELVIQRCGSCTTERWPPRPLCRHCGSTQTEWIPVAGRGHLYSWTTIGRAYLPSFADDVPYTVGVVELDEPHSGVRFVGTILHDEDEPRVGDRCIVDFVDAGSDVTLPVWNVATTGA